MCDVLGEFIRPSFQVTNSLFDNIQPRAYAIDHALIPMNTFQFQDFYLAHINIHNFYFFINILYLMIHKSHGFLLLNTLRIGL